MSENDKTPLLSPAEPQGTVDEGRWTLTLVHGPQLTQSLEYPFLSLGVFGRSDESPQVVNDPGMSRRHFAIAVTGPRHCEVKDLDSTNGTFVQGQRIHTQSVEDGSIIRAAGSVFVLEKRAPHTAVKLSPQMIGDADAWLRTLEALYRVAVTTFPVLLLGETGTGKELLARAVHQASGRKGHYVTVNCSAVPKDLAESVFLGHVKGAFTGATGDAQGHFVAADRGTLFLDEVGDMPLAVQAKVLRALDSGEVTPVGSSTAIRVDTRVVCATNVDLAEASRRGTFRKDLYARLAGVLVRTPPVRERIRDILPMMRRFFADAAGRELSCDAEAAEALLSYQWPHNVRELRSVAQRLSLEADGLLDRNVVRTAIQVDPADDASDLGAGDPGKEELARLLGEARGRVSEVASALGKDRKQVYRWARRHGLDIEEFRK